MRGLLLLSGLLAFLAVVTGMPDPATARPLSKKQLARCISPAASPEMALEACTALIEALEAGPETKRKKVLPLAYLARGNAHARLGRLDSAVADVGKAIDLDPGLAPAYVIRAGLLAAKGDLDKAIADLDRAIQLKPDDPQAFVARGGLWLNKGDHRKALADFDRALQISPDSLAARFSRGLAHEQAKALDKARADYEKVLASSAATPRERMMQEIARQRLAALGRASAGSAMRDRTGSGTASAQSNRASALALKGALLLHSGKPREAIALLDKALALNPPPNLAFAAYGYRGMAWSRLGKYDKAVADFTEALKIKPDDAATLVNRGNAWMGMGNHEKARADYEKVLSMPARTEADKEAHAMARQALKKMGAADRK